MGNNSFWQKFGWIFKNIALAFAIILALVIIASIALRYSTQHGKEVTVPDFTNMELSEAQVLADSVGLRLQVTDSVYIAKMRKNAITHQYPASLSSVKKGRVIDLTTNSRLPGRVAMPSLIGLSTQQAISELKSRGLELGWLEYVSDIASNNVRGQKIRGVEITPGTLVRAGTSVSLIVGYNSNDNRTYVPDLKGRKYMRAIEMIHDRYLNVGDIQYDETVRSYNDRMAAFVYKQIPAADANSRLMGTSVRIWLTTDPEKLK